MSTPIAPINIVCGINPSILYVDVFMLYFVLFTNVTVSVVIHHSHWDTSFLIINVLVSV